MPQKSGNRGADAPDSHSSKTIDKPEKHRYYYDDSCGYETFIPHPPKSKKPFDESDESSGKHNPSTPKKSKN